MDDIAFRYNGGPGITGIPARDITVAEFRAMPPDQRRQVKHLASYEPVEQMSASQLNAMKRGDLNAHAATKGIADPDAYESKDALIKVLMGEEPPRQPTPAEDQEANPGPAPDISYEDGEDE